MAADVFPDGTPVKKGDCVNLSPYAMGRMEWLWGKDATDYNPERFLKDGVCQPESPFKLPAFLVIISKHNEGLEKAVTCVS